MKRLVLALTFFVTLALPLAAQDGKGGAGRHGPGEVVVVNRLDRAVTVWINGEMKGYVGAGAQGRFGSIQPGGIRLQAGAGGSAGPVASESRTLAPGETFTWTLYPLLAWEEEKGTGTVVVSNGLDRAVHVFFGENEAGVLAPGARRAYARIVAGEIRLSARDDEGAVLEERTLSLAPSQLTRWTIGREEEAAAADTTSAQAPASDGSSADSTKGSSATPATPEAARQ